MRTSKRMNEREKGKVIEVLIRGIFWTLTYVFKIKSIKSIKCNDSNDITLLNENDLLKSHRYTIL